MKSRVAVHTLQPLSVRTMRYRRVPGCIPMMLAVGGRSRTACSYSANAATILCCLLIASSLCCASTRVACHSTMSNDLIGHHETRMGVVLTHKSVHVLFGNQWDRWVYLIDLWVSAYAIGASGAPSNCPSSSALEICRSAPCNGASLSSSHRFTLHCTIHSTPIGLVWNSIQVYGHAITYGSV